MLHTKHDGVLAELVLRINRTGSTLKVSLHIGEKNVTGLLCAADLYAQGLANHVRTWQIDGDDKDKNLKATEDAARQCQGEVGTGVDPHSLRYLHMHGASITNAGGTVIASWWRGRIEDVDSWSIVRTKEDRASA